MIRKNNSKEKKKIKKIIVITLSILAVFALVTVIFGYFFFKHYYNMLDYQSNDNVCESHVEEPLEYGEQENDSYAELSLEEMGKEEIQAIDQSLLENVENMESIFIEEQKDTFHLLLIGVDSRSDNFSGRSDAMILVTIQQDEQKIMMTSFLRDIYVSIPGYENNRLNAAYAYGGSALLLDTIKANFGIEIDRYAVVNFYSVMDFVDALGGVEIEVSEEEMRVMNQYYIPAHNKLLGNPAGTDMLSEAGTLQLNGSQTLAYARVRYVGTDFARTNRQREIISRVGEQAKELSITELLELTEQFLPKVRTDLSESECLDLIYVLLELSEYEIDTMTIPIDGTWSNTRINGMSVLTIDFEENVEQWRMRITERIRE